MSVKTVSNPIVLDFGTFVYALPDLSPDSLAELEVVLLKAAQVFCGVGSTSTAPAEKPSTASKRMRQNSDA